MTVYKEVTIRGYITTQGKLHISAPDDNGRFNPKNNRMFFRRSGGQPCTLTRYEEFRLSSQERERAPLALAQSETLLQKPGIVRIPVIPSTTMRGRLRRQASDFVLSTFVANNERVSYDAYQVLRCGAVSGRPQKGSATLSYARAQHQNVHMGSFGGGPFLLGGQMHVNTAYPTLKYLRDIGTLDASVSENDLIETNDIRSLLGYDPIIRSDDVLSYRDANAENRIANYDSEMEIKLEEEVKTRAAKAKQRAADEAGYQAKKSGQELPKKPAALKQKAKSADEDEQAPEGEEPEESEETERGLRTLSYCEYIVGGVPFYWSCTLSRVTDAQVGLALQALDLLFKDPRGIGGKSAVGYGRVSQSNFVIDADGAGSHAIFTGDGPAGLNTDSKFIGDCLDSLNQEVSKLTARDFDALVATKIA